MPKNNFELLSKEKQDAILSAAKVLFSEHLYDDISMDILVKALALPIATFIGTLRTRRTCSSPC